MSLDFKDPGWSLRPAATVADLWAAPVQISAMMAEAQMVVAMRILGMAGFWAVTPNETHRMFAEKQSAFATSMKAATRALAAGKRPDEVMSDALRPIRRRTRSNLSRLAKRGPQAPGL